VSEAYYLWPAPGSNFPPEALDEWRRLLDRQPLTVKRTDGAYLWFADHEMADSFRQSGEQHTEFADLIVLGVQEIEIDASYAHDDATLAVLQAFLSRFKERWPYSLGGPSNNEMTVDEFIDEYRIVRG
jgi:hypothetical protein